MTDACRECKQPLLEIGNRGEHLTGCMACNIWWSQEGKKSSGCQWRICTRFTLCDEQYAFDCSRLCSGGQQISRSPHLDCL